MDPSDLAMLATLDALLQEGSVTAAARRMGVSTPAMSHALARLRERLRDPLLVRAGRGLVRTPRAEELRPRVRSAIVEAQRALAPPVAFEPAALERTFVLHATDYVLTVLGLELDRVVREEAPRVCLRFVPNGPDDPEHVRDGRSDVAIGIYGTLPPELRSRVLLTDRFVCVVREGHPLAHKRLTLEHFTALPHVQVAPRGAPGGYVDDVLRERGLARVVARAVPSFVTALQLCAHTDYVLTVAERIALQLAPALRLRVHEAPIPLRPYALSLLWHPRFDNDPAHAYLRDALLRSARAVAGTLHARPRTRLDPSDPTSGQRRKRPKPTPL